MLYTLMTLTYFTEYNQDINIPAVFSIGVTDKICQMISNSKNDELKALAFRYCGNMTLGDQKVTEVKTFERNSFNFEVVSAK